MLQHLADGRVDLMMGRGNTGPVFPWFGQDIRDSIALAVENYALLRPRDAGRPTTWALDKTVRLRRVKKTSTSVRRSEPPCRWQERTRYAGAGTAGARPVPGRGRDDESSHAADRPLLASSKRWAQGKKQPRLGTPPALKPTAPSGSRHAHRRSATSSQHTATVRARRDGATHLTIWIPHPLDRSV